MSAHSARPQPDPALTAIRDRLQQQYTLHHRTAPFWTAYQSLQQELVRAHPRDRTRLCNAMAELAEELGAVEHAQRVGNTDTGSTSR
ncbi:hypothetical protein [Stenotrophomonas maltophilia]|uniref:hypothetical protein n=1 Tax=Stenotrophomonas maltophilia TaxID=40324 RepID=UPI0034DAEE21